MPAKVKVLVPADKPKADQSPKPQTKNEPKKKGMKSIASFFGSKPKKAAAEPIVTPTPTRLDPKKAALMDICLGRSLNKTNLLPSFSVDKKQSSEDPTIGSAEKSVATAATSETHPMDSPAASEKSKSPEAKSTEDNDCCSTKEKTEDITSMKSETSKICSGQPTESETSATETKATSESGNTEGLAKDDKYLNLTLMKTDVTPMKTESQVEDDKPLKAAEETNESEVASSDKPLEVATEPAQQKAAVDTGETKEPTNLTPTKADQAPKNKSSSSSKKPRKKQISDEKVAEYQAKVAEHTSNRAKYQAMVQELLQQANRVAVPLELELPVAVSLPEQASEFPKEAVPALCTMVESNQLPLAELVNSVVPRLNEWGSTNIFTDAMVEAQIPLIATNKQHFKNSTALGRWEVSVLEILPNAVSAKQARAACKKLATHYNACAKYLASLDQANTLLQLGKYAKLDKCLQRLPTEQTRIDQIVSEEEKKQANALLKARQAQVKAQQAQARLEETKRLKQEAAAEKKRLKEEAAAAKKREKQEAAEKKGTASKANLVKQKKRMMSFFQAPKKKAKTDAALTDFDLSTFRASLNNKAQLPTVKKFARRTCGKRVGWTSINVFVTPEIVNSGFGVQPFAEVREVRIRNRYKLLRFHEDVRPPYYGSWSKATRKVTGRKPFEKDDNLDYDNDSEAEWEEGDDEVGDDVENDDDDNEEDVEEEDEDHDGWLAADDEIDDNIDEETQQQRKRAFAHGSQTTEQQVCIIGPNFSTLQGIKQEEARTLIQSHRCTVLNGPSKLYLDAFPPEVVMDDDEETSSNKKSEEESIEDLKVIARFVHGSDVNSKDKLVDELRKAHKEVTRSRAHAARVIEGMADKKRHPVKGTYWQVKAEVLESLSLEGDLDVGDSRLGTIARLAHHSTCTSKDRLVDEIMSTNTGVIASRAEGIRILDAVAEKKKDRGQIFWQVRPETQKELGLWDLEPSPPKKQKVEGKPAATK